MPIRRRNPPLLTSKGEIAIDIDENRCGRGRHGRSGASGAQPVALSWVSTT